MERLSGNTETQERDMAKLYYHYRLPIERCTYGIVTPGKASNDERATTLKAEAYRWIEQEVGFQPLLMTVGRNIEIYPITESPAGESGLEEGYKQEDEANNVLFSYERLPSPGIFLDYNKLLNALIRPHENGVLSHQEIRGIRFRSGTEYDWRSKANKKPDSVRYAMPSLDLRTADLIMCGDQKIREVLIAMGFINVVLTRHQ